MTDILQELREPLPKVEGYNGEYVDEDAVLSIFKDAADEIQRLRLDLYKATIRMEADDDLIWQLQFAANDQIELLREALRGVIRVPDKAALDAARAALGEKE